MPEKYLRVTMPDGSRWDVPARLIAELRAEYYAKVGSKRGDPYEPTYQRELAYGLSDASELIDWAANNMDWSDVAEHAVQVEPPKAPSFEDGWGNGDKEIVER